MKADTCMNVGKEEHLFTVCGCEDWRSHYGNNMEIAMKVPHKARSRSHMTQLN